jgi:hypothetical protein
MVRQRENDVWSSVKYKTIDTPKIESILKNEKF